MNQTEILHLATIKKKITSTFDNWNFQMKKKKLLNKKGKKKLLHIVNVFKYK